MRIFRNKKGITLVELMVSMLLFTIIAAAVSAILMPMLNSFARANELAECNTLLDSVANVITRDLSKATEEIGALGTNILSITVNSVNDVRYLIPEDPDSEYRGLLLKNGVPVFAKSFYKNKSVGIICARDDTAARGVVYKLTVIILSDKYGEMIRRDYTVRPLALPANQYLG